jgi:hypothetical protein
MSTLRVLFAMARADFFERTRRYSFLIVLGLVLYLGYTVNAGQITLQLGAYRGIANSAWVGGMMTLVVNFFLGWFGFYVVKNAITRDYETGVGQILATTPLSRPAYLLGKWLSNFAVLACMMAVLMVAAVVMQIFQREEAQFSLWPLVSPFLLVALPFLAVIAALAVLFETIPWLRGGFGNLAYFFFFTTGFTMMSIEFGPNVPLLDWMGFGLFSESMGAAARSVYPTYQQGFSLGVVPPENIQTFWWEGITWTMPVVLARLAIFGFAVALAGVGTIFFDRFDSVKGRRTGWFGRDWKRTRKAPAETSSLEIRDGGQDAQLEEGHAPAPRVAALHAPVGARFSFLRLLGMELRLLGKGLPWWWYAGALGIILASAATPAEVVRQGLLPAAWLWPTLLWSSLGTREAKHQTGPLVFSAPRPLLRQLPALWLAGVVLAALMGSGAAFSLLRAGDMAGLLSLAGGCLFVPALAAALGVWSGSSKAFEIVYVVVWYIGPVNRVDALDFTRAPLPALALIAALLLAAAYMGRRRQIRND